MGKVFQQHWWGSNVRLKHWHSNKYLPKGRVTAGNLPDASSFGCASLIVGYISGVFLGFWWLQVLAGLGIFPLFSNKQNFFGQNPAGIQQMFCGCARRASTSLVWLLVSYHCSFRLNSTIRNQVYYIRPVWFLNRKTGCHGPSRYQEILFSFGVRPRHDSFHLEEANTCYQNAVLQEIGRWDQNFFNCPCDEYAYRIPNPKHTPKYTRAKVPHTQDKHAQLSSFADLCCWLCYPIKSLAATSLPEYVDIHSLPTGCLRP